MPRRDGIQFTATPQGSQLAHFVNVSDFELWIHNPKPNPFDTIANPQLLFGLERRNRPRLEIPNRLDPRFPPHVIDNRGMRGFVDRRNESTGFGVGPQ